MSHTIVHRFEYDHAPEVVWEYLTNPEKLAAWLMPNDFKPVVGHTFQFGTKPKFPLGFDGRIYCEVLEIIPYQKLVYSWKGGLGKSKPSLDSIVEWTLEPKGRGTILHLKHSGFSGVKNYLPYIIMNKGWLKIGNRLALHLSKSV